MLSRRRFLLGSVFALVAAACKPMRYVGSRNVGFSAFALTSAPNGGWCWFADARAYYYSGKTYFGWLNGSNGEVVAAQYDHSTHAVSTPANLYTATFFEMDDHDNPALLRRSSDGKILAGYMTHVGDPYSALSVSADDATAFTSVTNLVSQFGSGGAGSGYTYAHLVELSAESKIYFTVRRHDGAGVARVAYSTSSDDGATWAHETDVCTATYHKVAQNGTDRIDFVLSNHPDDAGNHDIRHMYYQSGAFHKSDGTVISASQPFAITDTTQVYNGSTTMGWLWDIAIEPGTGYPIIVFATFPGVSSGGVSSDSHYNYARWNGSAWTVTDFADAGGPIPTADQPTGNPQSFYSGGVVLDHSDPSIVYASIGVGSGTWQMRRYVTADNGATFSNYTLASTGKNVRPVAVLNHASDLQVLWLTGTYTNYVTYSQGISGAGL